MTKEENSGSYEKLIKRLYLEAFPATAAFVSRAGGSMEQASDVFQDALVIYYENVITQGKQIETSEKAYLLGIARHLWYREQHRTLRIEPLNVTSASDPEEVTPQSPSSVLILGFLETAGQKCMNLLKAFYYDRLSLSRISEDFGYSGTRSATVQKYKCLEKVREEIQERKLCYEDFVD